MTDLLYLLGTFAFFGLMLGYVSFCERIGHTEDTKAIGLEKRP